MIRGNILEQKYDQSKWLFCFWHVAIFWNKSTIESPKTIIFFM